jgi:hypothetical protein
MQATLCSSRVALAAAHAAPSRRRTSGVNSAKIIQARRFSSSSRASASSSSSCGGAVDLSDLSRLPGDPSLTVHTNVAMGEQKMAFMKAASGAVAKCLGGAVQLQNP